MTEDIIGKELIRPKKVRKQNLWQIIAKDVFIASLAVYLILSWFEWRSPRSVSYYFSPGIFFFTACIVLVSFFVANRSLLFSAFARIKPKTISFLSWLVIMLLISSSILFYLISNKKNEQLTSTLAIICVAISLILYIFFKINPQLLTVKKKGSAIIYVLLFVITIWGGSNIFYKIDKNDIFHDEKWHVQVIESLKNKDGFKKWNFLNSEHGETYRRGRILNTVEYFIVKFFGQNNFTLRLVPAITGVLLIPLVFFVFRPFIGSVPALLSSMGFSFSIPAIFLARFLRPYTTFLFFYLLSFYFSYKLIELVRNKNKKKKVVLFIALQIISVICTAQANQMGKILFLLIPLSWLFVIINDNVFRSYILKNRKKVTSLLLSLSLLLILFESLKITNFILVLEQAKKYLSIESILKPEKAYFEYIFSRYTKATFLIYLSFIFGCLLLFWKSFIRKNFKSFHLLSFTLIPFFFVSYLLSKYEDFRYCYFIIPFVYSISMFGFFVIFRMLFIKTIKRPSENSTILISVLITILFVFYPLLPQGSIPGITITSPAAWSDEEGQQILHRRAIAPEYKKAFDFINDNQKPEDNVVISEGEYYLQTMPGVNYFFATRKSKFMKRGSSDQEINFFELINDNQKLYFVVAYSHLLNKEIVNYLLSECENKSKSLDIKKYNYTGYYSEKALYWPSVFVCNY